MPLPPPMKTGKPTTPRRNHTRLIKKDSPTGNRSAIRNTIKFIIVIFGAIGSGVGMLRYADMQRIAENKLHKTRRFVGSSCFVFVLIMIIIE